MPKPSRASEVRESKEGVDYLPARSEEFDSLSIEHLVIDDGKPVDNIYSEVQMRLLTEPLYSSWKPGRDFVAKADVGVFSSPKEPPIVPDVLLAMDIKQGQDLSKKANLSYFVWLRGKVPDVVIEIVSQYPGGEDREKLARYEKLGVSHYVIWDPLRTLRKQPLRYFKLEKAVFVASELPCPLRGIGLGLTLWQGSYEGGEQLWLRWTDEAGKLIPTGAERADREASRAESLTDQANREANRADEATMRAVKLAEFLRQQGFDPDKLP